MRETRTSGSVGALGAVPQGYPTFGIQPLRGSRSKSRRSPEVNGWSHIHGHAGDAAVVSAVRSGGDSTAFVGHSGVAGAAPLMAKPLCAKRSLAFLAG